jgi:hypothetical protein
MSNAGRLQVLIDLIRKEVDCECEKCGNKHSYVEGILSMDEIRKYLPLILSDDEGENE